jgi:hypothetical protein
VSTNDIKFNVKNGLAVGSSGTEVIDSSGQWVSVPGATGSPYGATGAVGSQGVTGDQGASGATGTTGQNGTQGIVGSIGTTGNLGTTGQIGNTGVTGDVGLNGFEGPIGADGTQGVTGVTGTNGVTGNQGDIGLTGTNGLDGDIGTFGATGPAGDQGTQGPSGARYHATSTTTLNLSTGATGVTVVEDNLNYSAGQTILLADGAGKHIHAAVTSFNPGTKILAFNPIDHVGSGSASVWEINLDGAEGAAGATGVTGVNGGQGATGSIGTQGVNGTQGTVGDIGTQGTVGPTGDNGIQGASGAQGLAGTDGTGKIITVGGTHVGANSYTGFFYNELLNGSDPYGGQISLFDVQVGWLAYGPGVNNVPVTSLDFGNNNITIDSSYSQQFQIGESYTFTGASIRTLNTGFRGPTGATGSAGSNGTQGDQGTQGASGSIGLTGATGIFGATGLQGGDGSGAPAATYTFATDWSGMAFTGSSTGVPVPKLEFSNTEPIYDLLDALSIGDTITIDFTHGTGGQTFPQTVTIQSGVQSGGSYAAFWIQVSAEPGGSSSNFFISDSSVLDTIVVASGPTNKGYVGATGVAGVQGGVGNAGYNADQLTTGTARGAWDPGTAYNVNDIVITAAPADSHRCLIANTGFDPDLYPDYWQITAWVGEIGATGYQGATGAVGTNGASGVTGNQGDTGTNGAQGIVGSIGTNGASGPTGANGDQGINGDIGTNGASGPTGGTGTDGATGYHGLQFKATANGNFSISAVGTNQLAVPFLADPDSGNTFYNYSVGQGIVMSKDINNYMLGDITATDGTYIDFVVTRSVGTVSGVSGWVINLDGSVGIVGASGATGHIGATGVTGNNGTQGVVGDQGATGADGAQGYTGSTGVTGVVGFQGDQGINGAQGTVGNIGDTGIIGDQGTQGDLGASGATGIKGFSLVTGSTGLSTTSLTTIDMFAADAIGTAKYLVQGVDGSTNVQATQVILTQNNSSVFLTEYATLRTGSKVMDVTATTDGSIISLKVTPTTANTTFSFVREDVVGRIG